MSNRVVVIHQPDFLPYLGFFQRLIHADIFIVLDNVQFVRGSRGMTHRDKIKTNGGEKWINVGVEKPPYLSRINEVKLNTDVSWRKNDLNLIKENYKKSPFYDEIFPHILELFSFETEYMWQFNMESIFMINRLLGIDIEIKYASDLNVTGHKNELIINLVKSVGSNVYLSGVGAKDYYVPEMFEDAAIKVIWQQFNHPVYPQQFGEFIPYLSTIDLLFNCGMQESRKILERL